MKRLRASEMASLATLSDLIALAREVSGDLQQSNAGDRADLLRALSAAQVAVLRMNLELEDEKRRRSGP